MKQELTTQELVTQEQADLELGELKLVVASGHLDLAGFVAMRDFILIYLGDFCLR